MAPGNTASMKSSRPASRASSWGCIERDRRPQQGQRKSTSQPPMSGGVLGGGGGGVSVKNDPFMTHHGNRSEQIPGRQRMNLRHDPMMIGREAAPQGGNEPRGRNNNVSGRNLQITVCYVTNLKIQDWGFGRRPRPYVLAELTGTQQRFKAFSREDKGMPPGHTVAQKFLPTNFEHAGIFRNVQPGSQMRFRVQEDGMMGASDLCKPFTLEASRQLLSRSWDRAVEEILPMNGAVGDPNTRRSEMKVRIVAVKENRPPGNRLRMRPEEASTIVPLSELLLNSDGGVLPDRGSVQDLTVIATLNAPAERGQTEVEADVPFDLQRRLGLKAGESVHIAPEVPGIREMARIIAFGKHGNRNFVRLDSRLRHSHGVGTTLAVRSKDAGMFGGWCTGCAGCCLGCFEQAKLCFHNIITDSEMGCMTAFWSCCVCCLECGELGSMGKDWCCGRTSLVDLRRTCARRCNLPYNPEVTDPDDADTGCCCIPLRMAVFILSMFTFFIGVFDFFFPSHSEGIDVKSHVVSGVVELIGLPVGLIGAVGAWELEVNMLIMYNYFQMLRLAAKLFVMYNDAPLLVDCDIWRTDINAAIKKHGWNKQMHDIAMDNSCSMSLVGFVVVNIFLFWLYMYLISLTRKLIWACEDTPNYLISMPKEAPSGAFHVYSRTQGANRPPYGSIDGTPTSGQRRPGLVGSPIGVAFKPLHYNASLAKPRDAGMSHFTY